MVANLQHELAVWRWTGDSRLLLAWIYLRLMFDPCFLIPDWLSALSLDGERLSSIYRLQCSASEESCVHWWQRGEQHAWGEVKAKEEGGKGGAGGEGGKIHYIYRLPAWLAIHPELQVISSLPCSPSSSSQHPISSISRQQNDHKTKKQTMSAYNWTKHRTENDRTHTGGDDPSPSSILDPFCVSIPLPAPCNLHTHSMLFSKNTATWLNKRAKMKGGDKDF